MRCVSVVGKSLVKSVAKPVAKTATKTTAKPVVHTGVKHATKAVTKTTKESPKQENAPTKESVDIHKIFNRSGIPPPRTSRIDRSMDPKLARILYDTSALPKVSTKPLTKPKDFSFSKREKK